MVALESRGIAIGEPLPGYHRIYVIEKTADGWSTPEFAGSGVGRAIEPGIEFDDAGVPHLIWGIGSAQVPAAERRPIEVWHATRTGDAWGAGTQIGRSSSVATQFARTLVRDKQGSLHAIVLSEGLQPRTAPALYLHSFHDKKSTSKPIGKHINGVYPGLAATNIGLLATFAAAFRLPGEPADVNSIFVSLSRDNGSTWETPLRIRKAGSRPGYKPVAVETGAGVIHLIWGRSRNSNTIPNFIEHSYSDNGECWSEPVPISATESGAILDPILLADSRGGLHLFYFRTVGFLEPPFELVHVYFDGTQWSRPSALFNFPDMQQGFGADIGSDDSLHLVFRRNNTLFYTTGRP